jgi:DNA-binding winged helix-turn-helix (wHTH) protein
MAAGDVISFGPYRRIPAERLLLRGGETVDAGSRALDVLIALRMGPGLRLHPVVRLRNIKPFSKA